METINEAMIYNLDDGQDEKSLIFEVINQMCYRMLKKINTSSSPKIPDQIKFSIKGNQIDCEVEF